MSVSRKCKTNKETLADHLTSIVGRFPEGGWLYMGFKLLDRKMMHQKLFRNNMLEPMTKTQFDKYVGWGTNAYICPQVFSHGSRAVENLYALQNMVIDVDIHSERYGKSLRDQKISTLAHILLHDADDYGLPEPNWVVFTGRGLQIWWRHESMAANKCLHTWTSILRCFIEIIKQLISEHLEGDPEDTLGGLSVDEQASLNPIGFFRIPGTYNPAAKTYASIIDGVDPERIYSYKELVLFRNRYQKDRPNTLEKQGMKRRYQVSGCKWDASAWAESTAFKIETLRDLRNEDIGNETRNNFCLALYSLYRSAGMEETAAMERLNAFNEGFKQPMRDKELKSTLFSARKKIYRYSTSALVDLLGITKKEISDIGLKYNVERPKSKRKQELSERNQEIIRLYRTTSMTQKEVGDAVGTSRKVVGDVLRSAGVNRASLKADEIRSLNEKGKSIEQITETVGCSDRTVYRALRSTADENAGGALKAAPMKTPSIAREASEDPVDEPTAATFSVKTFNASCEPVFDVESREGEIAEPSCDDQAALVSSDVIEGPATDLSASDRMYLPTYYDGYHATLNERSDSPSLSFEPIPGAIRRLCLSTSSPNLLAVLQVGVLQ